jgi:AraC family transcriptional regulator
MQTEIAVKDLPAVHAIIKRTRVARDNVATALAQILPPVFEAAQQHGLALAGPPFSRYPEMGMGTVVVEAGFPVAVPVDDLGDGIEALLIPAGLAAVTVHRGPYESLGVTYAAIEQWAVTQGRTLAGPPRENYLTDPGEHPDPATWETEIIQPIA